MFTEFSEHGQQEFFIVKDMKVSINCGQGRMIYRGHVCPQNSDVEFLDVITWDIANIIIRIEIITNY